ncbi:MAG: 4-hydroxythreonine-4-phosphate dehydrogenase PdxA, partial [Alistipes sp.]|nr:4-hydroxythreonine-4-phosphate dehydrogenase PdxA [Alistipes sp.]
MTPYKLKIGITQGDPNGIGWEVILKALSGGYLTELCTPIIYGAEEALQHYRKTIAELEEVRYEKISSAADAREGKINLVVCGKIDHLTPGKPTPEAGRAAVEALQKATAELKEGALDAIVTAPFDKETVQSDEFRYTGHTEFFGAELQGSPMMIMCSEKLRVGLVTKHLPVAQIAANITREKILADLATFKSSLTADFGVVAPRIAVLALN